MNERIHTGHNLAMAASIMILVDTVLMIVSLALVIGLTWMQTEQLEQFMSSTPLPFFIYAVWALGVFGTAAAIVAIVLYGFRARWFWRCLVVASVMWLAFPPIHAVIGLVSLVLLIRFHHAFPKGSQPITAAP